MQIKRILFLAYVGKSYIQSVSIRCKKYSEKILIMCKC